MQCLTFCKVRRRLRSISEEHFAERGNEYNIKGHIGAYIPNERGLDLVWSPNIEKEYSELKKQELLSAYKKIITSIK